MISAIHPPLAPNTPRARLIHRLEMQSLLIENVINQHSAETLTITRGHVEAQVLRYNIPKAPDQLPLAMIERALTKRLAAPVRLQAQEDGLAVLVSHSMPPVSLLQLVALHATPAPRPYTALLGIDNQRQPVWLDLLQSGHVVISGEKGSGKSSLLRTIAATAAAATKPDRLRFLLLRDRRDSSLDALNYLPTGYALQPVSASVNDIVRACQRLAPDPDGRRHTVVLVDNVDRLLQAGRVELMAALSQLLLHRRGITVIFTTRDGRSDWFRYAGNAFGTRLFGRSAERRPLPTRHTLLGAGDFIDANTQRYFQAAYADPYDLSFLLAKLKSSP